MLLYGAFKFMWFMVLAGDFAVSGETTDRRQGKGGEKNHLWRPVHERYLACKKVDWYELYY